MGQEGGIKIRTLPRGGEARAQKPAATSAPPRWIVYVGTTSCLLLIASLYFPNLRITEGGPAAHKRELSSQHAKPAAKAAQPERSYDSVNRHLQEATAKTEMMIRARELENLSIQSGNLELPDDSYAGTDSEHLGLGVQFDQENSAERVYADLNEDAPSSYASTLPEDMINSRLANRRWVNELERAERVQFVRNFIRSAAERGYEVQIDANLVVVGVKKINRTQKVSINSVLDTLAQKGR